MTGVLVGKDGTVSGDTPVYAEGGIKDGDSAVGGRGVEVVTFVLEDGRWRKDGKTVGKALGDEELTVIIL